MWYSSWVLVQQHLRDHHFHRFHQQLCNSICWLKDNILILWQQPERLSQSKRTDPGRVSKWDQLRQRGRMISWGWARKLCSRSHRRPQSVTLESWEVKEMIMAINIMAGVKVKIEAMPKDVTARGSDVFAVRVWDIEVRSAWAPL